MRRVLHTVAASLLAATVGLTVGTPAMADKVRNDQWHLTFLEVAKAQAISQGEGVTVAVVDTGIDNNHPDLSGNILPGLDVVVGGAGNGWGDKDGHGTGMAGLIAAHGHGPGNGDGAMGLAPKAKILPIRINTGSGLGDGTALALAVDEAVKRGAKIVAVAINSDANSYDAVQRAIKAGVIVVAASGNRPRENFMGDPAAHPGVVAVGAVGQDGNIADISVRGPALSLVAPGVDIVSSGKDGDYRKGTGTSPSTALVSGAAALVWSKYPQLTSTQVVEHLTKTATDKGAPGRDSEYGFGVLNIVKALTTEPNTAPTASPTRSLQTAPIVAPSDPEPKSNIVLWGAIGGGALIVLGLAVLFTRRRSASR
jgi:type VII secretion-associated serine protease mycosin